MSELVADCPRCSASHITFDITAHTVIDTCYDWQNRYETFCVCRHCHRSTIFILAEEGIDEAKILRQNGGPKEFSGAVNKLVRIEGVISLKDTVAVSPPEHLPKEIESIFLEGATCLAVRCFNAAGTMFRLCVDLTTKFLLPETDSDGLNSRVRRNLGLRLPWLFDKDLLPKELKDLSSCIKEDGNDGAHEGSLKEEDAEDLLDFTIALLERLYTEPKRLCLAKERREKRRNEKRKGQSQKGTEGS